MRTLKKTLALVLVVAMMMSLCISASAFKDDAEIKYDEAVEVLTAIGVIDGFPEDDTFRPGETLTRAQAAKIITYMLGVEKLAVVEKAPFEDVPANHWAAAYIAYCVEEGIVDGYGNGKYGPNDELTGYQWAKMLLAALGVDTSKMVGSAWQIDVAKAANTYDLFAGNLKADKTADATREEACLYALNALNYGAKTYAYPVYQTVGGSKTVVAWYSSVTEAAHAALALNAAPTVVGATYSIGPKALQNSNTTLLKSIHGVNRIEDQDVWGRPYVEYYNRTFSIDLVYYTAPIASYVGKITECDVAVDMELNGNYEYPIPTYLNGYASSVAVNPVDTLTKIGAQGRLIEIYEDRIVMLDQYLAQVINVTDVKVDAAGHLISPATLTMVVYNQNSAPTATPVTKTVVISSYANYEYNKYDMILVNAVTGNGDSVVEYNHASLSDYAEIIGLAPEASGVQTAYDSIAKTSTIGGAVYSWAEQYHLGNLGSNYTGYVVYTNTYGDLLGLAIPQTAYSYGVITQMAWTNSYQPLTSAYAAANLVMMDGTSNPAVAMAGIKNVGAFQVTGNAQTVGAPASAHVNADINKNTAYYKTLYKYTVDQYNRYTIDAVGTPVTGATIKSGTTNIWNGDATNDYTVYLVETKDPTTGASVYTTYTGYKNVPSMGNVNISYFADYTGYYVEYVYVDATNATYTGESALVYIGDVVADGSTGLKDIIYAYVNGTPAPFVVANSSALANYTVPGVYKIERNLSGEITAVTNYFNAYGSDGIHTLILGDVVGYTGTSITDTTATYNCTGAKIFKMVNGDAAIVEAVDGGLDMVANASNAFCVIVNGVVTEIYYK